MIINIDLDKLQEEKRLVIKGFGLFELLPRRKGDVNCYLPQAQGKSGARYTQRIKWTPAKPLKEKICK